MKNQLCVLVVVVTLATCSPKKTETTSSIDSLAVDSAERVMTPAPSGLAFDAMMGYTAKSTATLSDSVNFLLLASQEDLDKNFVADKSAANEVAKPDFIINYIIGVVGMPSQIKKTISLEKVEATADAINVYVSIQNGEKLAIASNPSQIFAIERREAANIQFFVNGKKDKSFFMTGL